MTEKINKEEAREVVAVINEVLNWIALILPKGLGREIIEGVLHDLRHNAERGEIPE